MDSSFHPHLPTVIIFNNLETFFDFLNRADDSSVIEHRLYRGDRALMWAGDEKLVFATSAVQHDGYLREHLGYAGTHAFSPEAPTPWLSEDILREPALLNRIIEYAGSGRAIQMIPYATTPQFLALADALRSEHGLEVVLPESPEREHLWLRDYMDTKSGFRVLASHWLRGQAACLPEGVICEGVAKAADAAWWFVQRGKSCIVKADKGEGSLGHFIIHPGEYGSAQAIADALDGVSLLHNDLVVVEEHILSSRSLSPSLEFFVPPNGGGEPILTYAANQLFLSSGAFDGVVIDQGLVHEKWYAPMLASGLALARRLQQVGYVGHFDLDAVVGDDDCVFLLESNMRRTGGTHTHEFARRTFGPDYLNRVTLFSHNKVKSGAIRSFDELLAVVGDLLFPVGGGRSGVVITVTSALSTGEFGCIIVGESVAEATRIYEELIARIQHAELSVPAEAMVSSGS